MMGILERSRENNRNYLESSQATSTPEKRRIPASNVTNWNPATAAKGQCVPTTSPHWPVPTECRRPHIDLLPGAWFPQVRPTSRCRLPPSFPNASGMLQFFTGGESPAQVCCWEFTLNLDRSVSYPSIKFLDFRAVKASSPIEQVLDHSLFAPGFLISFRLSRC